ncbi:universal stress protein [Burkholderia sp. Nafp2/4-1b]|uniref:universal stress protein n=1 Tax=Burkholderia sp. Nafp2/4-1b TaxID=2116686 RepID=UPI000EF8E366|nr:universal stress protein [Burkholderia sp. Nafp2/4-1b]RKU05275.1 universal stress protein [Burkholderia sp. Nafp2/4-1b]
MYTNIMVAVDGSPSSNQALDEAVKMAKSCGARLFAVFVVDKSLLITYAGRLDPDALLDEVRRDGAAVLRSAERTISHAAVNGDTEILETDLGQDIAERLQRVVVDHSIDLAVIGTHGRRGVRRLLLGSVAERFLRGSRCPVLLVRSNDAAHAVAAAA